MGHMGSREPDRSPGLGVVRASEEGRAQARCDGVGLLVREMLILSGLFGYFLIRGGFSPKSGRNLFPDDP